MRWDDAEGVPGLEVLFGTVLRDRSAEVPGHVVREGACGESEETAEVQLHPAELVQVDLEFLNLVCVF